MAIPLIADFNKNLPQNIPKPLQTRLAKFPRLTEPNKILDLTTELFQETIPNLIRDEIIRLTQLGLDLKQENPNWKEVSDAFHDKTDQRELINRVTRLAETLFNNHLQADDRDHLEPELNYVETLYATLDTAAQTIDKDFNAKAQALGQTIVRIPPPPRSFLRSCFSLIRNYPMQTLIGAGTLIAGAARFASTDYGAAVLKDLDISSNPIIQMIGSGANALAQAVFSPSLLSSASTLSSYITKEKIGAAAALGAAVGFNKNYPFLAGASLFSAAKFTDSPPAIMAGTAALAIGTTLSKPRVVHKLFETATMPLRWYANKLRHNLKTTLVSTGLSLALAAGIANFQFGEMIAQSFHSSLPSYETIASILKTDIGRLMYDGAFAPSQAIETCTVPAISSIQASYSNIDFSQLTEKPLRLYKEVVTDQALPIVNTICSAGSAMVESVAKTVTQFSLKNGIGLAGSLMAAVGLSREHPFYASAAVVVGSSFVGFIPGMIIGTGAMAASALYRKF